MPIVIVDVETTGLSPQEGDRVVEIAAMKIKGEEILDRWESLIYPGREMSFGAMSVNGITDEMLVGCPPAREVLPEFMAFIGDAYIMGHNVRFDWRFINHELMLAGYPLIDPDKLIDTVRMARGIVPGLPSYALIELARFFKILQFQLHRAMPDVELTHKVFCQLVQRMDNKGYWDVDHFVNVFGIQKTRKQNLNLKCAIIKKASLDNEAVKVLYMGNGRKTSFRKVVPKKILGEGKEAIMVGYCYLREDERYFNLDRIVSVGPIEPAL